MIRWSRGWVLSKGEGGSGTIIDGAADVVLGGMWDRCEGVGCTVLV